MKHILLLKILFFSFFIQFNLQADLNASWNNLISAVNGSAVIAQTDNTLIASIADLESTVPTLQTTLDTIENQINTAIAQAAELEYQQALIAEKSYVMRRGMLNNLINETDRDFVIYFPDNETVSIPAQSVISLNKLFSSYLVGVLICGVIRIVPQVAGQDISSLDAEAQACGVNYYLQFNMQGLNEPGYAYGALDYISITRVDIGSATTESLNLSTLVVDTTSDINNLGNTRAHSLDLDQLVAENELWSLDVTLNYVPTRGDGKTYIYPRFSNLKIAQFDENDETTFNPLNQENWDTEIIIDESNSDTEMSYPAFTGDTAKFWGDLAAVVDSDNVI
jgi:hypothetical protein